MAERPFKNWMHLLPALGLLSACAGAPQPANGLAKVQGGEVQVRVHLSEGSNLRRKDEFNDAAQVLAATPLPGLDQPLVLHRAVLPMPPPPGTEVTLRFGVSDEGYVVNAQLRNLRASVGSAPPASMGLAMLQSLRVWRFEPPLQDRQPVAYCCISLVID